MIRVLIVEDSATQAELLSHLLHFDPDLRVIAVARNGEEAVNMAARLKPDVVTMDINMPKMNGFEATRRIMETTPVPIVIVSGSYDPKDVEHTFRAIEAGALAVVEKPAGMLLPAFDEAAINLVRTVKLMSEVKVVKRWPRKKQEAIEAAPKVEWKARPEETKIVAIGGSTGAPNVLQTILSLLPGDFPIPLVIVQHMAAGFTQGFAQWLGASTGFPVHMAIHGQIPSPANAYVAPDGMHLKLSSPGRIILTSDKPENGVRPSVSYFFRSAVEIFGRNVIGVLLSGMGKDGAAELKLMKESGALTIVQDKETSVVHGMPGEALTLGAATYVLSPDKIAAALKNFLRK